MKFTIFFSLVCLALFNTSVASDLSTKISKGLRESLLANPQNSFNIFITPKNNQLKSILAGINSKDASFSSRTSRSNAVYNELTAHALESQKEALEFLNSQKSSLAQNVAKVKSFWITNQLYVAGASKALIEGLVDLDSIASIEEEGIIYLDKPVSSEAAESKIANGIHANEWQLDLMRVQEVWDAPGWGNKGAGVLVGVIDTGVRATHENIRDTYVNDGHSWRDPYDQYYIPTDMYDHGTHVCGSVVGKDGIGVAPEARWIACKGYRDDGSALVSAFFECGEFLVCPTDEYGNNPDCSKTVNVAQNSWGLALGGGDYSAVLDVWETLRIMPIFANGNYGPTCGLVYSPADNVGAIGVGATDSSDRLASFSGRGPSDFGVLKPDISAPGVNIYSCDRRSDTSYSVKSGTSMASPVAAGVATLMVGANPNVTVAQLKYALESTASKAVPNLGASCGGISDSTWPNNHYGHGRIDAYLATQAILRK